MASIWKDIEIDFKGKTYKVRPSLTFINQLEQGNGNSIQMTYYRATQGDLPSVRACEIICTVLKTADPDLDVTVEDVFEETGAVGAELTTNVISVLLACLPTPKETKTTTNAKKKSKGKAKPKAKTSTSATSTE